MDNTERSQKLCSWNDLAVQAKISVWLRGGRYGQSELRPALGAGPRPRCHVWRCTKGPSQQPPVAVPSALMTSDGPLLSWCSFISVFRMALCQSLPTR